AGERPEKTAPPFERKTYVIRFAVNSNEFSADTYSLLNQIVAMLSRYRDIKIVIRGHTDSIGNYEYNKRLSDFRANMVKIYFVGQGVDPDLITTMGMGPDDPIADNKTAAGRRANRRVEIILIRNA
ncbi:MAG: OmpA family protein, partial [Deltaproteobacteria bacterium]